MAAPVKIYGVPRSRAFRTIWVAEECRIDYELVPTSMTEDAKAPSFLKINPNAKIPALVDGDVTLFESLAMNLYLERKYGGDLWPDSLGDEGQVFQWTLWTATEIEPQLMAWYYNTILYAPEKRDPAVGAAGAAKLSEALKVLDGVLASGGPFLLGSAFTAADLNVACVLYTAWWNKWDFAATPAVKTWLERCVERAPAKAARAMREAA